MIDSRRRNTALLVAGCFFMENFDGTIVTTSAPRMAEAFGVEPAAVGLVSAAYLITLAVLIPLSNWLTRRYGTRPVFLSAIVIFTLASLGCALSQSLPMLVIMRILQGVGGAMMVPVGRMAVLNTAEKSDIVRLVAYIVWPALVAPVIAPLAGGLITTYLSWHWMFLINLPLGVVAFIAAWRLIDSIDAPAPPPLDWTGMVLSGIGLGGLTYAAHLVTDPAPGPWPVIIGAASVIITVIAVRHLLRARHPLLNLRIWSVRTFRASQASGFAFMLAMSSVPFLLPLLFQQVFGWSAIQSGAVVLCVFIGNIGIKPATTGLINAFGFRPLLVIATIGLAGSVIGLGLTTTGTPIAVIAVLAMISGVFRSLGMTCYNTIGLADVPADRMGDANALSATTHQLAAGLAIALASVVWQLATVTAPGMIGGLPYSIAFAGIALFALLAAIGAIRLPAGSGDAVRHPARVRSGGR
ncbi:MFS transporter [Microlunatus speluncae]|uniref:MFS transporter n=1 Tax=Microlunatus speluncae TaxID=2594267 RepID=UPI00126625B8|nr:MFS transporter [Microlunatus speluncae]